MKTKDFTLQVKDLSEEGTFEGYGSVYGNVDSYGEKVMPGAFMDSLVKHKREGTRPLMLYQHNPDAPIGVWEDLAEDGKGLFANGRLLIKQNVPDADKAYSLLKAGALRGMSIGYREVETKPNGQILELRKLDLLEISVVSFPANGKASVTSVKSEQFVQLRCKLMAGELPSEREFERGMRDAFELSNSEAERAVRLFFKAQGEPGVTAEPSARLIAIAKAAAAGISIRK